MKLYEKTLVPMMFLMFALGAIVIVAGFSFDQADFAAAMLESEGRVIPEADEAPFRLGTFMAAAALLFSSFIGFDSIAQAGGEARNPNRALPLAIGISVVTVGSFYILFTAAVYHAVPWAFVAEQALMRDITAPGLLGYLLPAGWTVAIVAGAAVALTNDLPAMLLAVSRLMFAWAEDGIFPRFVARVHPTRHTPGVAIVLSGLMASGGILEKSSGRRFFSRRRHPRHLDAGQFSAHVRLGAVIAPPQPPAGTRGSCRSASGGTDFDRAHRHRLARNVSRRACLERRLDPAAGVVFPFDGRLDRGDGSGERDLRSRIGQTKTRRRRSRGALLDLAAGMTFRRTEPVARSDLTDPPNLPPA